LIFQLNGGPPKTPEDWISYLDSKLNSQKGVAQRYADYYDSKNTNLQFAQVRFEEAFGELFQGWQVNFCPLIVDSISERIRVTGFRMTEDPDADKDAWRIWQENHMDADSNACHIDTLALGSSYVTVWKDEKTGRPTMTPESAMDMYVQYETGSRRNVAAALKRWRDDWGTEWATWWTPEEIWTAQAQRTASSKDLNWTDAKSERNPLGVVPVVPIMNRTRLRTDPFSELEPIIPLADAISKIAADALVASEYAAFPQRYVTGMEVEEDASGNAKSPFQIAIDRMLVAEDPQTAFGQFQAADLGNYVKLIDNYVAAMAAITRIPFHYFLIGQSGQAPSGEAITSAEAGLVAKAKERQLHFGESWESAMRLAFKVMDDPRADAYGAEVMWTDPEYRSQSALVDSAVKLAAGLQVPLVQLWGDVGYSPQEIERFPEMRETDYELAQKQADMQIQTATAMAAAAPKDPTAPTGGKSNTPKNTSAKKPGTGQ
jgi:hypothetical protein